MFEPGSIDRERLNLAANRLSEPTVEALGRAGARPGHHILDVGCGPGAALLLLAETVGPAGLVVGLDVGAEALGLARDALAAQDRFTNVHLVEGDINALPADALAAGAPFDLALCRLLLTHQTHPAATLRAVARVMRPGGRIIAMDPLRTQCLPRYDPPVPALERIRELDIAHLQQRGLAWDVAWDYGDLCEQAGLRLLDWRGGLYLSLGDSWGLQFQRRLLPAQQQGLIESGLTTQSEIEGLVASVDAAIERGVHRSASAIMVTLIAEVPASA